MTGFFNEKGHVANLPEKDSNIIVTYRLHAWAILWQLYKNKKYHQQHEHEVNKQNRDKLTETQKSG